MFELILIPIFLPKTFSIFETFKPPNLNMVGLLVRWIIVDSNPILHFPPSKINFIPSPNSSFTSLAWTALSLVEIFALGAAKG